MIVRRLSLLRQEKGFSSKPPLNFVGVGPTKCPKTCRGRLGLGSPTSDRWLRSGAGIRLEFTVPTLFGFAMCLPTMTKAR
jgi:hypothetical protein